MALSANDRNKSPLDAIDLQKPKRQIVKLIQRKYFLTEITQLQKIVRVDNNSRLNIYNRFYTKASLELEGDSKGLI